jgi:eukaryotic-like serine/threonine-protein kinase
MELRSSSYPGVVVASRFELRRRIGQGAGGAVWLAYDRVSSIAVALKILHSNLRVNANRLAAFEREARICERVRSPSIVRVLAFGLDDGNKPYIAYELLTGRPLDEAIASAVPPPLEDFETVVVQVARGLTRAHSIGVVHRDIKPANIFLTRDDRQQLQAKILDFGISSMRGAVVEAGAGIYGTLEYVAPEVVFQTSTGDFRSDLYSLAVTAYEYLTGSPPIVADSVPALVGHLASREQPRSVEGVVGAAGAIPLDAWFRKGLARDPSARFESALELADELQNAILACKVNQGRRFARPQPEADWAEREVRRRSGTCEE